MKSKEHIFSNIEESAQLPSLPHILVKLIDVCDDETVPIQEIAPLVAQDSALSSKVLRLINSAYFGLNRTFSDLDQAVVYLGAGTIKNLAITASVQQVFSGIKKQYQPRLGAFWYTSLLTATLGKRIGQHITYSNSEEAYLSGLLHNIGELLLLVSFPQQAEHIMPSLSGPDLCQEEIQQIGISHCEAGSWLLKQWKINPLIADAALYHHHDLGNVQEAFPLVKITFLAARLAEATEDDFTPALDLASELFDLEETTTRELFTGAKDEVEEIASSLEVDISPGPVTNNRKSMQHGETDTDNHHPQREDTYSIKNKRLTEVIQNDSLLTGYLRRLISAEGKENILAATEEIIRLLYGSGSIFFLLFDPETKHLKGTCSLTNPLYGSVKDLVLSTANTSSLVFTCLKDKTILTPFTAKMGPPTNLADTQLLRLVNSEATAYVPLIAQGSELGIMVMDTKAANPGPDEKKLDPLKLIADQCAITLHLDLLQRQEAQKLLSERMTTASLAAKKIVHEVNNPLGIISNYLKLLEIKLSKDTDLQAELKILDEEIERISTIIGKLSHFAAPSCEQRETVDVNNTIANMLRIFIPALLEPAEIQLNYHPLPGLPTIESNKNSLKQVILNLVKNAAEALVSGGAITISTGTIMENEKVKGITISIQDNGPGITEQIQNKLYSPFLTTKEYGHSGLGLSIVHRAVQDLGGKIACESNRAQGTVFRIFLPLTLPSDIIKDSDI